MSASTLFRFAPPPTALVCGAGAVARIGAASLASGNIATTPRLPGPGDVEAILAASLPDIGGQP